MFHNRKKLILIAGCGRLGAGLCGSLSEQEHSITVIDKDKGAFRKLSPHFGGFKLVGDATDVDILEHAGITKADILIACTDDDNINSMIAQIASRIYNIGKVFVRLNDTDKEEILDGMSIQAIYPAKLSIQEFEKLSSIHLE